MPLVISFVCFLCNDANFVQVFFYDDSLKTIYELNDRIQINYLKKKNHRE